MNILIDVIVTFVCWKAFPNLIEFGSIADMIVALILVWCLNMLIMTSAMYTVQQVRETTIVSLLFLVALSSTIFVSLSTVDVLMDSVVLTTWGKVMLDGLMLLLTLLYPSKKDLNYQMSGGIKYERMFN